MKSLPLDFLHECFCLDAQTGELRWRERPRRHFASDRGWAGTNKRQTGKLAGATDKGTGYRVIGISVNGKFVAWQYHRIVFAMVHGRWPNGSVDHIDGDPLNNRPANLRECSHEENMRNQGTKATKRTKLKGAFWHARIQKWQSAICVAYKQVHLGYHDSEEAAHDAYVAAAARLHGDFANYG